MFVKYITVVNRNTGKRVPFVYMPNGEIMITSIDPNDDEDSCSIRTENVFYEYSHDLLPVTKL